MNQTNSNVVMKPINGYEGKYSITNDGRVFSHERYIETSYKGKLYRALRKARWLKPRDRDGYQCVAIDQKNVSVHRLVADAFIDNPNMKPVVNHINGIKHDNRVENLEWCTQYENDLHAKITGLLNPPKGENHPLSKLTNEDVIHIRESKQKGCELAKKFNVPRSTITKIRKHYAWKHT